MDNNNDRKRTLYISDLDGTLLGADSRVSQRSTAILNELVRRGVMFTCATARTPATVQPLLSGIRQSVFTDAEGMQRPLPAIVMTGAGMWNRAESRFEKCSLIGREDAEAIHRVFVSQELRPFVYCVGESGFINVYHPENDFARERFLSGTPKSGIETFPSRTRAGTMGQGGAVFRHRPCRDCGAHGTGT